MRKKIVWGSVVVALLMLVSTQMVFLNTVKSWPSEHEGDAFVGNMWVSELNTTSVLQNVKNVSIGHANATHDWVKWLGGIGTVRADWSVDIGNKHPEYFITFMLHVFNIDDNSSEIGNDNFMKTYNANTSYDESGTLSVLVAFGQSFLAANTNATLVCYLDAVAILNNTAEAAEAVNFTNWGQDRSVVGVSLDSSETSEPFSRFTIEANEEWPSMWSWFGGWNEISRFDDEEDMLNNQTYLKTGLLEAGSSSGADWTMGELTVRLSGLINWQLESWVKGPSNYDVSPGSIDPFTIPCDLEVNVLGNNLFHGVMVRHDVVKVLGPNLFEDSIWHWCWLGTRYPANSLVAYMSYADQQNKINLKSYIWLGLSPIPCIIEDYTITITGDNNQGYTAGGEPNHFWESSCVYQNHSFDISASSSTANGITTLQADITEVLQSQSYNQTVYSYAGDRGDTRVEFTI